MGAAEVAVKPHVLLSLVLYKIVDADPDTRDDALVLLDALSTRVWRDAGRHAVPSPLPNSGTAPSRSSHKPYFQQHSAKLASLAKHGQHGSDCYTTVRLVSEKSQAMCPMHGMGIEPMISSSHTGALYHLCCPGILLWKIFNSWLPGSADPFLELPSHSRVKTRTFARRIRGGILCISSQRHCKWITLQQKASLNYYIYSSRMACCIIILA